ncbi:hydroxyacid dehydrogenase [Sphingobium sp. CR2-8]|uniref:hydroxyacid dehydrogenase n=1 Tax=Sphingobium sp. CR2-8 TaxID=1306534 RepID=UPI002DBA4670|nr:hydroxyacid dehydrogenase [Sphingobium sp. CR2-8]MEC3909758.1 hydroxyacid dehydrogenase [Sphingobium sp. CR2-8]
MSKDIPTALIVGGQISPAAVAVAQARGVALTSCDPYPTPEQLIATANACGAKALIIRMGRVTAQALDAIPSLKIIAKHGVGVDGIDLGAAAKRDVPVVIAGGANAQSVAEQALALLLSVARSTAYLDRRLRAGAWDKSTYAGTELTGKSIGLIGLGVIGRAFLTLLAPFGMTVRVYDPYLSADRLPHGAQMVESIDTLLEASDIVSLHCPLTPDNCGLIDAAALGRMKDNAILINTARGELIDEPALVEALRTGVIAGAGLDTFASEPTGADHPLWTLDNVVGSPHVGANTHEARVRVGISCVEQIADYLDSGRIDPRNHVNAMANA